MQHHKWNTVVLQISIEIQLNLKICNEPVAKYSISSFVG